MYVTLSVTWSPVVYFDLNRRSDGGGGGGGGAGFAVGAAGLAVGAGLPVAGFVVGGFVVAGFCVAGAGLEPVACAILGVDDDRNSDRSATTRRGGVLRMQHLRARVSGWRR